MLTVSLRPALRSTAVLVLMFAFSFFLTTSPSYSAEGTAVCSTNPYSRGGLVQLDQQYFQNGGSVHGETQSGAQLVERIRESVLVYNFEVSHIYTVYEIAPVTAEPPPSVTESPHDDDNENYDSRRRRQGTTAQPAEGADLAQVSFQWGVFAGYGSERTQWQWYPVAILARHSELSQLQLNIFDLHRAQFQALEVLGPLYLVFFVSNPVIGKTFFLITYNYTQANHLDSTVPDGAYFSVFPVQHNIPQQFLTTGKEEDIAVASALGVVSGGASTDICAGFNQEAKTFFAVKSRGCIYQATFGALCRSSVTTKIEIGILWRGTAVCPTPTDLGITQSITDNKNPLLIDDPSSLSGFLINSMSLTSRTVGSLLLSLSPSSSGTAASHSLVLLTLQADSTNVQQGTLFNLSSPSAYSWMRLDVGRSRVAAGVSSSTSSTCEVQLIHFISSPSELSRSGTNLHKLPPIDYNSSTNGERIKACQALVGAGVEPEINSLWLIPSDAETPFFRTLSTCNWGLLERVPWPNQSGEGGHLPPPERRLSVAIIVTLILSFILAVALLVGILVVCVRRRRKTKNRQSLDEKQSTGEKAKNYQVADDGAHPDVELVDGDEDSKLSHQAKRKRQAAVRGVDMTGVGVDEDGDLSTLGGGTLDSRIEGRRSNTGTPQRRVGVSTPNENIRNLSSLDEAQLGATLKQKMEHHRSTNSAGVGFVPLRVDNEASIEGEGGGSRNESAITRGSYSHLRSATSRKHELIVKGHFKTVKLVGRGSYGSVYSALLDDGSSVAVKKISLNQGKQSEAVFAAVEKEVEIMRDLSHPHVLRYYAATFDRFDMTLNIFTELISGGSLGALVRELGTPLGESAGQMYTAQIVAGLAYIHGRGIVHRDLKADNVLVSGDGTAKIADFGASKSLQPNGALTTVAGAKTMIGTPLFMAPEILMEGGEEEEDGRVRTGATIGSQGSGYGRKADVWSLGVLVGEILNKGRPPWPKFKNPGTAFLHICQPETKPIPPKNLSSEAKDFIMVCCTRNPKLRPTAKDLLKHPWIAEQIQTQAATTPAFLSELNSSLGTEQSSEGDNSAK